MAQLATNTHGASTTVIVALVQAMLSVAATVPVFNTLITVTVTFITTAVHEKSIEARTLMYERATARFAKDKLRRDMSYIEEL